MATIKDAANVSSLYAPKNLPSLTPSNKSPQTVTGMEYSSSPASTPQGPSDVPPPPPGPVDVPSAPTQQDFLASDPIFLAQKKSYEDALKLYEAENTAARQTYDTNYNTGLRQLGFTGDASKLDKATWKPDVGPSGAFIGQDQKPIEGINWNMTDETTGSGRAFTNALNDFAARGMLRGSAYAKALNNLARSLNEQLSSTATARTNQMADYERQLAAKRAEAETSTGAASNEAINRWKAQYGIA